MSSKTAIARHLPDFQRAGRTLLACGCNNSHSGNLSIRDGETVVITRAGAMLGSLAADDLVVTSPTPTSDETKMASSELPVHLAIYRTTLHAAIAHAHSPWAILAGWLTDALRPIDVEGALYFGCIPVVECVPATASKVTGDALAAALGDSEVAILRGHGVFAGGDCIERAMQRVTSVNDSARLYVEARRLGLDTDELGKKEYLRFNAD